MKKMYVRPVAYKGRKFPIYIATMNPNAGPIEAVPIPCSQGLLFTIGHGGTPFLVFDPRASSKAAPGPS